MIATHNIKVNGRWVHAGEEYTVEKPVPQKAAEEPKKEVKPEQPAVEVEKKAEPAVESKPKAATSTRRKSTSTSK